MRQIRFEGASSRKCGLSKAAALSSLQTAPNLATAYRRKAYPD
ncbi:hypothetical protein [Pyrobaculum aerophilum]|nr:hypothetical protein [Pyrobaculum aerophilum]